MLTKRVFDKSSTHHDLIDKFQCHAIFLSNSIIEIVRHKDSVKKILGCCWALKDFVSGFRWDAWHDDVDFFTCQRSWLDPTLGWVWHNWRHEQRPGCRSLTEVRPYLLCLQCRWPPSTTQNSIQSFFFSCRYLFLSIGDFCLLCFDIWMAFV